MGSIAQSRTIRAARLHGHKDMRVDDIPTPDVGPGQLIVDVEWCGICGSDLHEYVKQPLRHKSGTFADRYLARTFQCTSVSTSNDTGTRDMRQSA